MEYENIIEQEKAAFDKQTAERIKHGFVPDLRRLKRVEWFYNNVWRDPEFVRIHWMPRINWIIEHAKSRGGRVLELGCGLGMLSLECARNGLEVTGIDLSPKSIEVAIKYKNENPYKDNFGSLDYICGDFTNMDLKHEHFDTVIFFRTLHHIGKGEEALTKVYGTLKNGGKLILSEPIRKHFTLESAHLVTVLRMNARRWIEYDKKLNLNWNDQVWEEEIGKIFSEYAMEDEHEQSPLDNTLNSAVDIIKLVGSKFVIVEEKYSDVFVDKLIGGLRGDYKYELGRFLKFLDDYMVRNEMLPPTSMELVAVKDR